MTRQEFTALLRKLEKHHGPVVLRSRRTPAAMQHGRGSNFSRSSVF